MRVNKEKWNRLLKEFARYLVVGGTAFLVDYSLLYVFSHFVFQNLGDIGVYLATALGFVGGLLYNYLLSLHWVFQSAKDRNRGKSVGDFLLFAIIGIIGLLLTEGGMYVGYQVMRVHYMIVKLFVAAVVLLWNYGARKIMIFQDERPSR
ncbi:hypothetical protein SDC9_126520 [bioreactor metagenome]|uniref:GtrA/DPMS transmembrane domain-containing protein n=1 Tax=bioreactor metagenome TaxID=1076179 RepID=A0A645CRE2_9ZZZZ|nr:GtrA family protein [Christensenella sp.]